MSLYGKYCRTFSTSSTIRPTRSEALSSSVLELEDVVFSYSWIASKRV